MTETIYRLTLLRHGESIGNLEKRLAQTTQADTLFAIRWEVT